MSTAIFKPAPRLRLFARPTPEARRLAVPRYEQPSTHIALAGDRVLNESEVARLFISRDPAERIIALNALNDRMQLFGDIVAGTSTVRLSNASLFPDQQTQGIPAAVVLGDADRQMVDTRWTALFQVQDRRAQTHPFFRLVDLYHAITVKEYKLGEQIQFGFVEANQEIFEAAIYGTGLQWNQLWSEWQDLWTAQSGMTAMQTKWANALAKTAYEILTATGLATTAYDTTGGSTLEKDINTINAGMLAIRTALFDATAPVGGQDVEEIVGPQTPYYLLYNEHTAGYEDRVSAAIQARYTIANDILSVKEVNRPIIPIASPYVPTGAWYLHLPGRKNVLAMFRDLRFYDITDPRVAGVQQGEVGWGSHRFVRGDANQSRKLLLA